VPPIKGLGVVPIEGLGVPPIEGLGIPPPIEGLGIPGTGEGPLDVLPSVLLAGTPSTELLETEDVLEYVRGRCNAPAGDLRPKLEGYLPLPEAGRGGSILLLL
jgi:hypothetical protein